MSMILCYVDDGGKYRETVIACDGGVFKLCRDEEERTFSTLHELLINHKPNLKRGLRFSRDLYNHQEPVQCITFPFSRNRHDDTEIDTKEAATRRAKITIEVKRTMQALIFQSVSNPQDSVPVESKSFRDLVLSIDSILSDGLIHDDDEEEEEDTKTKSRNIHIQGGYMSFLLINQKNDDDDELKWIVRVVFSNVGENFNHIAQILRISLYHSRVPRIFESKEQHANTNARTLQVRSLLKHSVSTNIRHLMSEKKRIEKHYRKDALLRT